MGTRGVVAGWRAVTLAAGLAAAVVVPIGLAPDVSSSPSTNYRTITPREFALIARDPDGHRGEKLVVFGIVTQFDPATGPGGFLAKSGVGAPCDALAVIVPYLEEGVRKGTFPSVEAAWASLVQSVNLLLRNGGDYALELVEQYTSRGDKRAEIVLDSIERGWLVEGELPRACQDAAFVADNSSILSNVVEGDLVTMGVEVVGVYSFLNQFGGRRTVPLFAVDTICDSPCSVG